MASKGQKFRKYSEEFRLEVYNAYKSGKYGSYRQVAKKYGISFGTINTWITKYREQGTLENNRRGRPKEKDLTKEDYKERYEILKKYLAFLMEQRGKK